MTPSLPIPVTEAERAETAQRIEAATGLNETMLEQVVRRFYERARQDAEIGAKFDVVQDWEHHIGQITAFWSSVALGTARYGGRPMAAHMPLDLRGPHFARWLALFEQTAREVCSEAGARFLMDRARRIAASLEMGAAVARGEMPQAAPRPVWARP